jgi:hypothetical protein
MNQSIIKKNKIKMKQSKDPFESPPPESPNSNSLKGVSEDEKDNMNDVELAKFPATDQSHKMAKMQLVTIIFILFFFSCHDFYYHIINPSFFFC